MSNSEGSANHASDFLHLGILVVSGTIFTMWWLDFSVILSFFVGGVNSGCLHSADSSSFDNKISPTQIEIQIKKHSFSA